jgi:predicted ATPase/DNA-binding SARP family transcriptional activator
MTRLKLFLLGQFHVTLDESPLTGLRSGKSRALLAFLAGEAGRPHQRSALATLLWGEHTNDAARLSLRVALSSLRDILPPLSGPPLLEITHQAVHLNPAFCSIDAVEFDAHLAACAAHPHQTISRCPTCIQRLTQAALLYRGDFLADLTPADSPAFDEWRVLCQERYHRQVTVALEQIAQHHLNLRHFDESQRFARQLLALEPWHEAAHRQLMRGLALGGQRSAALAQYELCRRALADELSARPEPETTALWARIRDGKLEQREITSLQAPLTPFMGRAAELEQIAAGLANPQCRLFTLVGPGGVGKTRLALAAAAQQDGLFPDGIYFVPAPAVGTADALDLAVAEALQMVLSSNGITPKTQLLNHLRHKEILLVLDDLQPTGAGWAIELLRHAPHVKILAAARQRLDVRGESLLRLEGLTYPASAVSFNQTDVPRETRYSAVDLFVQSARRAQPGFALTTAEWPHVARICQQVDGLPLALELAAAWIPTLSCAEIAAEIARDLDFLTTSLQDLPERHRSLRAVFDHSWDLLAPAEQAGLARMSVFCRGFDRFSAGVVAGAGLPILASLTEKALLRRETCWPSDRSPAPAAGNGAGSVCYSLHELVRQYTALRLAQWPGEPATTQDQHSAFFLAFVAQKRAALVGADQLQALTEMAQQSENVRAAWDWASTHERWSALASALPGLFQFYYMRSRFHEGEAAFGRLVTDLTERDEVAQTTLCGQALACQGWFAFLRGQAELALSLFARSLAGLRAADADAALAFCLTYRGAMALHQDDLAVARAAVTESLALYRKAGDHHGIAVACDILGRAAHRAGNHDEARRYGQTSLEIARALDNRWRAAFSLDLLGRIAMAQADCRTAGQLFAQSLAIRREMNDLRGTGLALNLLGDVYLACGAAGDAEPCYREALGIFHRLGYQAGGEHAQAGLARISNGTAASL